jgi:hypothetical protein
MCAEEGIVEFTIVGRVMWTDSCPKIFGLVTESRVGVFCGSGIPALYGIGDIG